MGQEYSACELNLTNIKIRVCQGFKIPSATIEFICHDHSIIACSRHMYVWCCSSHKSRSWWITHLTQHHRRGCNSSWEHFPSAVVLNQVGKESLPNGASINFQEGASPYVLDNMKSFWTRKCSVQFTYLKSGGIKTKDNYFREEW